MSYIDRTEMVKDIKKQLKIRQKMIKMGYMTWSEVADKHEVSKQNIQERKFRILKGLS